MGLCVCVWICVLVFVCVCFGFASVCDLVYEFGCWTAFQFQPLLCESFYHNRVPALLYLLLLLLLYSGIVLFALIYHWLSHFSRPPFVRFCQKVAWNNRCIVVVVVLPAVWILVPLFHNYCILFLFRLLLFLALLVVLFFFLSLSVFVLDFCRIKTSAVSYNLYCCFFGNFVVICHLNMR